jgi:GT2 family glycosyltransferase
MPTQFVDSQLNLVLIHNWVRKKWIFYKEEYYQGKVSEVEVLSGCFFLISTDVFKKMDYLD